MIKIKELEKIYRTEEVETIALNKLSIEVKEGEEGEYLFLTLPSSKRHNKPITSMPRASIAYKKLRDLQIALLEDKKKTIANDYVFMPQHANRDYAYRQIARQFDVLMSVTGLKESADGEARTLYSMRHTSLMYRLLYGGEINTTKLANNARTSTEMLERFYVPQLESSQFTKDLHAKKKGKKKKTESVMFIAPPAPIDLTKLNMDKTALNAKLVVGNDGLLKIKK